MSKVEYKKINEVCTPFSSNLSLNKLEDNTGEYPLYGAAGLAKNIDFYKCDKEFVSVIKDGAGIGRVAIHPAKSSILGTLQGLYPNDNINIKWLYYCLKSQNLKDDFKGATIPHIYFKNYGNNSIKVCDILKQQKIASNLDSLHERVCLFEREIELLDELVEAKFDEMFGDDKFYKQNLGFFCEQITKGTTPTTIGYEFIAEGINFIKIECIDSNSTVLPKKILHISEDCHIKMKRSQLMVNDILFSIAGALGRTLIIDENILPANTNQALAIIRIKDINTLNLNYLNIYLNSSYIKSQIDLMKIGAAQVNLSLKNISDFEIFVPSIEIQNNFSMFVECVKCKKQLIRKQITLTKELIDKKMDEYFGG